MTQDTCRWFHCLCISFLHFSLTRKSLLSHAGLQPSLPNFLPGEIESFRYLGKISLNSHHFYSSSLSPRAVFQGGLSTNSLNNWKFALLTFRVLAWVFTWPISLKIVSSTRAWSLQPWLPPGLTSPNSSSVLVCNQQGPVILFLWLDYQMA